MFSEIGSNFWISPNDGKCGKLLESPFQFGYKGSDYVWLSTGRSATKLVLQTIEERNPHIKKVALLPPFTCHTVYEPFQALGYEIHTLPISVDLSISAEDIIQFQKVTNASVLLVHRYYGFDTLSGFDLVVDDLRKKGVIVIEDCTQCLYSDFQVSDADYFVGSIRKWCGVPDGGFAICRDGQFEHKPKRSDEKMVEAKRIASELKYQYLFDGKGDKPTFKVRYREAEELLDNQNELFAIGDLSAAIQAELDVDLLIKKRRNNYSVLLDGFKDVLGVKVLFDYLPASVAPLYFAILVEDRSSLQGLLAENDIYAPVVWPKADNCPPVDEIANLIYNRILCIPIDQRYNEEDMRRIIRVINT